MNIWLASNSMGSVSFSSVHNKRSICYHHGHQLFFYQQVALLSKHFTPVFYIRVMGKSYHTHLIYSPWIVLEALQVFNKIELIVLCFNWRITYHFTLCKYAVPVYLSISHFVKREKLTFWLICDIKSQILIQKNMICFFKIDHKL